MDVAYISALSALAGSVVGGLTLGLTTWQSQRAQARAGQLVHDKSQREDLCRDFIAAILKRDDFSHVHFFEPSKISLQTSSSAGYEQVMPFAGDWHTRCLKDYELKTQSKK